MSPLSGGLGSRHLESPLPACSDRRSESLPTVLCVESNQAMHT